MTTQKDLIQRMEAFLQQMTPGSESFSALRFSEAQASQIEAIVSKVLEAKTASLAQHPHGGDANCPECVNLANHHLTIAQQKGKDETSSYYEAIPGVKYLRETYEREKADQASEEADLLIVEG